MLLYSLLPSTSEDGTDPGEASNINNVQDICIHYQGGIVTLANHRNGMSLDPRDAKT
jgi:hypothetical protein